MTQTLRGHVVFDFDGTLISSMDRVIEMTRELIEEYLGTKLDAETYRQNFDPDFYANALKYPIAKEDLPHLDQMWAHKVRVPGILSYQLFPQIEELLKYLFRQQIGLYVWTARDRHSTEELLNRLDLNRYFIQVRTGSDGHVKPHPQCLKEMIGHYDPSIAVMVGDSYVDILGGKSAGVKTVGATWCSMCKKNQLEESGPDFLASSVENFKNYLRQTFDLA